MSELRTRILRGSLAGGLARVATVAVGLVMTPYLLVRLGATAFGLWSLATAFGAAYGLLDFGLRTSIVKHMAESLARESQRELEQIVATCLFLYLGLGTSVVAAYLLLAPHLFGVLSVPEETRALAFPVLLTVLLTAAMSAVLFVFPGMLDARQRMDITQGLGVACLLLGALLTVCLVELGHGLLGVAIAQLASSLSFYLSSVWWVRRSMSPRFVSSRIVSPRSFSFATAKRLLRYGSQLYVSNVCEIVNRQLDKVLYARLGGLPLVASYEIAGRLVGNVGSLQGNLLAPLLPASSRLASRSERDRLRKLYLEASRYSFLVGIPPFFLLALLAHQVMVAWLGTDDPAAAHVLRLLAAGFLFNTLSHAMAATCQGIGEPRIQAEQSMVQLVANVVLSLGLIVPFGVSGPPLGTSLALMLGAVYFALRFHPRVGVDNRSFLRRTLLPPLSAAALATLAALVVLRLDGADPPVGRVGALVEISVVSVVFLAVFLGACSALGFVRMRELVALRSFAFGSIENEP